MKTIQPLLAIVLLYLSTKAVAHPLNAKYTITTQDNQTQAVLRTTQLNLWRTEKRVAHQYPATGITEGWEYISPTLIKATRYFDQHQRAIEYPPGERVHGKTEYDWSARNQFVSNEVLQSLELISSKQDKNNKIHVYQGKNKHSTITLHWMPEHKLVKQLKIVKHNITQIWQLKIMDITSDKVGHFFASHDHYQSTDYADIGDDHTDPFLSQMVHLGFIEHSASGLYQAQVEH